MSQRAFAAFLGLSRRTVQRKEAGEEAVTKLECWALDAVAKR